MIDWFDYAVQTWCKGPYWTLSGAVTDDQSDHGVNYVEYTHWSKKLDRAIRTKLEAKKSVMLFPKWESLIKNVGRKMKFNVLFETGR